MTLAEKIDQIRVSLVRCGRTQWATDGRLRGATDLPLSAEGRASMVQELAQIGVFPVSHVFYPPDEAAAETAEALVEQFGGKRRSVDALSDPDLGLLEGMSTEQFSDRYRTRYKRWLNDPLALSPPEGEPVAAARQRIFQGVARLLRKARNGGTVLVLHDYALGLLSCWLQERPASEMWIVLKDRPVLEQYDLNGERIDRLEQVGQPIDEENLLEGTAA